jgi:anti-sigma factor RsiW
MTCSTAHELMLTAEADELEARTAGHLAQHLRGCTRCRAVAEHLLATQREIRDVLATAQPRRPAAEAARLAVQASGERRVASQRLRRIVPLAAAAVLVGLLVLRRAGEPLPGPSAPTPPTPSARFSVTAPPGRSVAVLRQSDTSSVIVVWFF